MTLFNASASTISEIEVIENTDIEFISNGRLYCLLIDQEHLDAAFGTRLEKEEDIYSGDNWLIEVPEIEIEDWRKSKKLTTEDFIQVIAANFECCEDVTEYTDRGIALLTEQRKQTRKNLLSFVVSTANRLRSTLKNMSLAMHTAWTKARILASGVVNFVKVDDVDTEAEIVVQRRRVADGGKGKNGLLLFTDLDKYENFLREGYEEAKAKAKSFISMHVWQVVSWI